MRKISNHLEDVWGIYTELKTSLGEEYSAEELLESASRLIEVAKGKITKQKTRGIRTKEYCRNQPDTYTMMMHQPKYETARAIDDFCDYVDDDHAINFFTTQAKFRAYGIGA